MKDRIVNVGDDHRRDLGPLVRNLSFEELRSVAELLCDPSEMFGGLEAHPARIGQCPRDGRCRNAGGARDIVDRKPPTDDPFSRRGLLS
jgi:hypothetical protein